MYPAMQLCSTWDRQRCLSPLWFDFIWNIIKLLYTPKVSECEQKNQSDTTESTQSSVLTSRNKDCLFGAHSKKPEWHQQGIGLAKFLTGT